MRLEGCDVAIYGLTGILSGCARRYRLLNTAAHVNRPFSPLTRA